MLLIRLMNLPRTHQSALALGLAASVLAVLLALSTSFFSVLASQSAEIFDLRIRAGKLAVLAAFKNEAVRMAAPQEGHLSSSLLVSAGNLPIAKANLQSRINAIVAAHGGSVSSSGDVPDVQEKGLLLIGMRADISGTNEAIGRVLSDIEASKPPLMMREFVLRSEGTPPTDRPLTLTASFRVFAAVKPTAPSEGKQSLPSTAEPAAGAVQ